MLYLLPARQIRRQQELVLSLQSAALSPRPSPLLGLKAVHLQPGRRLPEGLQPPQGWLGALLWEGAWLRGPTAGPKVTSCFCSSLWRI